MKLYRHFDAKGELLYVGLSVEPIKRQSDHMLYASWRDQITRIETSNSGSLSETLAAEQAAIRDEHPKYNICHRPRRILPRIEIAEPVRVGPLLAAHREAAKLSKQKVAKRAKCSVSGIAKMEKPESNPTVKSIELYLRACGRTLGELFRANGNNNRKSA